LVYLVPVHPHVLHDCMGHVRVVGVKAGALERRGDAPLSSSAPIRPPEPMLNITQSITIARPPETVYALITDVEATPRWSSAISRVVRDGDGPLQVGDTFTEEATLLGRVIRTVKAVTALEEGKLYAEAVREGLLPHAVRMTLNPSGAGTTLTFHLSGDPGRGARLFGPLLGRVLKGQIKSDLKQMKQLLERS